MSRESFKIVIIDDNTVIRQTLKLHLHSLNYPNLEIYTSDDTVSGLQLIIALQPDLVLIDTTLPKHANKEAIEYLKSSKHLGNIPVILMHEGWLEDLIGIDYPENYSVITKRDPEFFIKITNQIIELSEATLSLKSQAIYSHLLRLGNSIDVTKTKSRKSKNIIRTIFSKLKIVMVQLYLSIVLFTFFFKLRSAKDKHVVQMHKDNSHVRKSAFRTFFSSIVFLILIGSQVLLIFTGGAVVFDYRVESVFETFKDKIDYYITLSEFSKIK